MHKSFYLKQQFYADNSTYLLAPYSKVQNRCDTYFPMLFNEECKQQIALVLEIRLITLDSR